jgi:ATP-dependent Lon protease
MNDKDLNIRIDFSDMVDNDAEFIPLMNIDDETKMDEYVFPDEMPILPLRNTVLFPGVVIPITVGREKSIELIKDANKGSKMIGVVSQKDDKNDDPSIQDLNSIGTVASILKVLKMPEGNTTVIIQGKKKFELGEAIQTEPYLKAKINKVVETFPAKNDKQFEALVSSIRDSAMQIITLSPNIPPEASFALKNIDSNVFLINFIASNMNVSVEEKQRLLNEHDFLKVANSVLEHLSKEIQMLELKSQIQSKVKTDLDKQQRDFLLNQQLKTIQEELGGGSNDQQLGDFESRAKEMKWRPEVEKQFRKEFEKLKRMHPNSAEYSVQVNYIENILDLPWDTYSVDNFDLHHAQDVLDSDHFGLEKVKERIIEYLAVLKLKGDLKSPIICLYGPPGVGKTSLGKSVAKSLGRSFVRMSLGGLKDESEVRGHRKTYIGAMPGRILQNLKKAKTSNPVFILDEIDKVGNSFQGDPSSALLEVLDPEQNTTFYDNYIEMDYDLSKVLFIATANSLQTIQPALRDRMEIIEINGYTIEEKIEISKRHLIPKSIEEHGLLKKHISFTDDVIETIADSYTRESGVRALEKQIAKVIRNRAKNVALEEKYTAKLNKDDVRRILGPEIFHKERYADNSVAGVVTGLAWTPVGGDILFIEVSLSKGKGTGKLTLTGNLGDVMKESAVIALEYLKSHGEKFGIENSTLENWNIHIHVPEGATPKDGPSAGITMLTALTSALTQRKVKDKIAMTGEITLRGKVLPVGGIKEKILAAKRAGINEIILCKDNLKDINEINESYIKNMKFHYVSEMHQVLELALTKQLVKDAIDFKKYDKELKALKK